MKVNNSGCNTFSISFPFRLLPSSPWKSAHSAIRLRSNVSLKRLIQTAYSNTLFKRLIQTPHSNVLFKRLIQTLYSNALFKRLRSNALFKHLIKTSYSNASFKTPANPGNEEARESGPVRTAVFHQSGDALTTLLPLIFHKLNFPRAIVQVVGREGGEPLLHFRVGRRPLSTSHGFPFSRHLCLSFFRLLLSLFAKQVRNNALGKEIRCLELSQD